MQKISNFNCKAAGMDSRADACDDSRVRDSDATRRRQQRYDEISAELVTDEKGA